MTATAGNAPDIAVVGSVNLDIVANAARLPVAGETVTDATLHRYPGGKGANQALAAKRLGARVRLHACVGEDASAEEALRLLRAGGVDLAECRTVAGLPTGTALIAVASSGENQIVVAPGANRALRPEMLTIPAADALICQLEVPVTTLERLAERFDGMFCINLAPAMPVPDVLLSRADLIVVNETEAAYFGDSIRGGDGYLAITQGSDGAVLYRGGKEAATSSPPAVDAVDTTGAGDTFTAALTVALVEGKAPEDALAFACAAGALAATVPGAQPSLPTREAVDALLLESSNRRG